MTGSRDETGSTDPRSIALPDYNLDQPHHLRVELEFGESLRATGEITFGGVFGDEVSTELTPVAIELTGIRKLQMLSETNRTISPWWIVHSDDKKAARLNSIRVVLNAVDYKGKTTDEELLRVKEEIVESGIDHIKTLENTLLDP